MVREPEPRLEGNELHARQPRATHDVMMAEERYDSRVRQPQPTRTRGATRRSHGDDVVAPGEPPQTRQLGGSEYRYSAGAGYAADGGADGGAGAGAGGDVGVEYDMGEGFIEVYSYADEEEDASRLPGSFEVYPDVVDAEDELGKEGAEEDMAALPAVIVGCSSQGRAASCPAHTRASAAGASASSSRPSVPQKLSPRVPLSPRSNSHQANSHHGNSRVESLLDRRLSPPPPSGPAPPPPLHGSNHRRGGDGGPLSGPACVNARAAAALISDASLPTSWLTVSSNTARRAGEAAAAAADDSSDGRGGVSIFQDSSGTLPGSGIFLRHGMSPRRGPLASSLGVDEGEARYEEELHARVLAYRRLNAARGGGGRTDSVPMAGQAQPPLPHRHDEDRDANGDTAGQVDHGAHLLHAPPRGVVARDPIAMMREQLVSPELLLWTGGPDMAVGRGLHHGRRSRSNSR